MDSQKLVYGALAVWLGYLLYQNTMMKTYPQSRKVKEGLSHNQIDNQIFNMNRIHSLPSIMNIPLHSRPNTKVRPAGHRSKDNEPEYVMPDFMV